MQHQANHRQPDQITSGILRTGHLKININRHQGLSHLDAVIDGYAVDHKHLLHEKGEKRALARPAPTPGPSPYPTTNLCFIYAIHDFSRDSSTASFTDHRIYNVKYLSAVRSWWCGMVSSRGVDHVLIKEVQGLEDISGPNRLR